MMHRALRKEVSPDYPELTLMSCPNIVVNVSFVDDDGSMCGAAVAGVDGRVGGKTRGRARAHGSLLG